MGTQRVSIDTEQKNLTEGKNLFESCGNKKFTIQRKRLWILKEEKQNLNMNDTTVILFTVVRAN